MTDRIGNGVPSPRRKRRLALLLAVLAPALVFFFVDRQSAAAERRALVSCVERAQSEVRHALGVVRGVAEYSSPQLSSPLVTRQVRVSLRRLVQEAAGAGVSPVRQVRSECSAVRVGRWHRDMREARDRYVSYLAAEATRLAAVQADFNEYGEVDPSLVRRRQQARSALLAVLSGGAQGRVDALLSP